MAYVYRFKDVNDNVIYVGYTGQQLSTRINQHFSDKGHLSSECYNNVARIEYQQYSTKADAQIMEVYWINKFKPKFNKLNKQSDKITFKVEVKDKWETYKVLKVASTNKPNNNKRFNIFGKVCAVIYILLLLLYFVLK